MRPSVQVWQSKSSESRLHKLKRTRPSVFQGALAVVCLFDSRVVVTWGDSGTFTCKELLSLLFYWWLSVSDYMKSCMRMLHLHTSGSPSTIAQGFSVYSQQEIWFLSCHPTGLASLPRRSMPDFKGVGDYTYTFQSKKMRYRGPALLSNLNSVFGLWKFAR